MGMIIIIVRKHKKQTNNVELAKFRENCDPQTENKDIQTMQETDSQNRPAGHTDNDMG